LLDNAIKYTRDGGHIEFVTGRHGNCARLRVSDDGIGIPADALHHVFERFFRADKARSRASGGAGLGLSIVKAICSAHSGEISVVSAEGHGTTFTVEFPLYAATQDGRGRPEPKISRLHASPQGGVGIGTPSQ